MAVMIPYIPKGGYGDTIYGGDSNDVIYANGGNNEYFGGNAILDGDGNITGHT